MFDIRRSLLRRTAYVGTFGLLAFAGAAVVQATLAPNHVAEAGVTADGGSCTFHGSAAVEDPHPGLHLGFETTEVYQGSGETDSCTSTTAISKIVGGATSTLTGTCIQADGTASGSHIKSYDANGNLLGQSSISANVALVGTADQGVQVSVSNGSVSGFMGGAIFAGVAASVAGANIDCLTGGTLSSASGNGSGTASR